MSALAGAVRLDGGPLSSELLNRLVEPLRYRAQDGEARWEEPGVALLHAHHWTTPEEVGEQQPLSSPDGRYHLTAAARIDNREELIRELSMVGEAVTPVSTDAELILAAFITWGEECASRLLGDFAFAVWDRERRRLYLARDVMGVRQLYHTTYDGIFLFATSLRALLAALPARPPLNRPLIEEFLRDYYRRWVRETVFQGVERLPPAHDLTLSEQGQRERLYYVLGSAPPPEFRTNEEWAAAFSGVLREAIRCRLRSRTPVAVITGGGLDSSAIACVAHELAAQDPTLPEIQLHAAYHTEPAADERQYFDEVATHCDQFRAFRVDADDHWALREFGTDEGFPLEEPELYPLRSHSLALLRSAFAHGAQVVLFGEGANQVLGHSVYYNPAAMLGVPLRNQITEFPHYLRASGNRPGRVLFHALVRPHLPEALIERVRPLRPGSIEWPEWVVRSSVESKPSRPLPQEFTSPPGLSWSARLAHQALRSAFDIARLAALDVTCAYTGVEWRLPFLDRRVVEFLLAAPSCMRSWKGEDRRILREAMRGILPEAIRLRRDKASMAGLIHRGLRDQARPRVEALLENSESVKLQFVKPGALRTALETYWSNEQARDCRFLRVLSLEAWLRSLLEEDMIGNRS